MAELVDLFAYLSVLLRGAVLVFQTLAVGGLAFERIVLRLHLSATEQKQCDQPPCSHAVTVRAIVV